MEILLKRRNAESLVALFDDEDFELVSKYVWYPNTNPKGHTSYAQANYVTDDGKRHSARMHVLIMGRPFIDHINGNGLDNRRQNLRLATAAQNQMNKRSTTGNSQFKGVCFDITHGRWKAYITANGKSIGLGMYHDEEDAARAYDAAAIIHHGEFARPNFPSEKEAF